jgi:hypothetical protein
VTVAGSCTLVDDAVTENLAWIAGADVPAAEATATLLTLRARAVIPVKTN